MDQPDQSPSPHDDEAQAREDRLARRRMFKIMGSYSHIGLEFGVGIALGYLLGSWLDGVLGTAPVLMYLLMAMGFSVGWLDLYRIVKRTDLDRMDDPDD